MTLLEQLRNVSTEEEFNSLIEVAISKATQRSKDLNNNTDYIGADCGINAEPKLLMTNDSSVDYVCKMINKYIGYVPLDVKVTFGLEVDTRILSAFNKGHFYYLDDESYIFDFLKWVKNEDTHSTYSLFIAISRFLKAYFKYSIIEGVSREQRHTLIKGIDGRFFEPSKQFSIRDFKGTNCALCSEYAIIANNILSVLGYYSIVVFDTGHAYNVLVCEDDSDYRAFIIDFAYSVKVFDINCNKIGVHPFISEIQDASKGALNDLLNGRSKVVFDDQYIQVINGHLTSHFLNEKRTYGVSGNTINSDRGIVLKRYK